jgi:hypothetical protein
MQQTHGFNYLQKIEGVFGACLNVDGRSEISGCLLSKELRK